MIVGWKEWAGMPSVGSRMGDVGAMLRVSRTLQSAQERADIDNNRDEGVVPASVQRKRQMIAGFCRMLGEQVAAGKPRVVIDPPLSPRTRQTLELLLSGEGEKQIAARLKLSQHTVHVYVKSLYRRFGVCSRAELLALWVRR